MTYIHTRCMLYRPYNDKAYMLCNPCRESTNETTRTHTYTQSTGAIDVTSYNISYNKAIGRRGLGVW